MCLPLLAVVAIAAVAVSAVSAGLQYSAQQDQANKARQSALASAADQDKQTTLALLQKQDATGQQLHQQNLQDAEKSADVATTFAANGTGGISLDALVAHVHNQADANKATITSNYDSVVQQAQQQEVGIGDQAVGRINANPDPSALGLGLSVVGSGLSGIAAYNKAMPDTTTPSFSGSSASGSGSSGGYNFNSQPGY